MKPINTGDTAWVLASAALVLFMTPGLALFYGGMVRAKNVLGDAHAELLRDGHRHACCGRSSATRSRSAARATGLIGNFDFAWHEATSRNGPTVFGIDPAARVRRRSS